METCLFISYMEYMQSPKMGICDFLYRSWLYFLQTRSLIQPVAPCQWVCLASEHWDLPVSAQLPARVISMLSHVSLLYGDTENSNSGPQAFGANTLSHWDAFSSFTSVYSWPLQSFDLKLETQTKTSTYTNRMLQQETGRKCYLVLLQEVGREDYQRLNANLQSASWSFPCLTN